MNSIVLLMKSMCFVFIIGCFTLNISAERNTISNIVNHKTNGTISLITDAKSDIVNNTKYFYLGAIVITSDIQTNVSSFEKPTSKISIYPNPANDIINIKFNANSYSIANIEIYNLIGEKISELQQPVSEGTNIISVMTNDLMNGVYLLKINEGGKVSCRKFIISK